MLALIYLLGIYWEKTSNIAIIFVVILLVIFKIKDDLLKRETGHFLIWVGIILLTFLISSFNYNNEYDKRTNILNNLYDNKEIIFTGKIYKKEENNYSFKYYLKQCSLFVNEKVISCNNIILYIDSDEYSLDDSLKIKGKVNMFDKAVNQGNFDSEEFYHSQKIDFAAECSQVLDVHESTFSINEKIYEIKSKLKKSLETIANKEHAGVLESMFLGDKSNLDSEIKTLYQATGISHILAISGLHITMIGMSVYRLMRNRGMNFLLSFLFTFILIIGYTNMTGGSVSTVRAVGMLSLSLIAAIFGRTSDMLNSLGFMILFILIDNPFIVDYAGFIFSVSAILSIVVTGKILTVTNENKIKSIDLYNKIVTSIGIWLTTLPIVAKFYYEVPLLSFVINLLVLPLLNILFCFGFIGMMVGVYLPVIGKIIVIPSVLILEVYEKVGNFFNSIPYSKVILGEPALSKIFLYYIILACGLSIMFYLKENEFSVLIQIVTNLIAIVILCIVFFWRGSDEFEINALDVGQGDGVHISTEEGVNYFIDGGSLDVNKVGEYRILPFLKSKGVSKIDYWFVSHLDEDHISGLVEIINLDYKITNIVISQYIPKDEDYISLVKLAKEHDIEIIYMDCGEKVMTDSTKMKCVYPTGRENFDDRNDLSMVLEFMVDDFSVVFTGDISSESEEFIVNNGLVGEVDYYKVAHHGSKYSSSEKFLGTISPKISTISCGKNNRFGHPGEEAVNNIKKNQSEIFYTMNQGMITIKYNKKEIIVDGFLKK